MFYYGSNLPAGRAAAAALQHAKIVLQPYHPLLTADKFAAYFPHCSLFVYWNPTGVPAGALSGAAERVKVLGADPVWNLARLDLRSAATRRFAVSRGLRALQQSGTCVAGLFVDDLDLWSGATRQDAAVAVVRAVLAQSGRDVSLFVNRGFALWPRLPDIAAVLLEEITPGLVDRMPEPDVAWVEGSVLPAIRAVRERGAEIFGLSYEPPPEDLPRRAASAQLAELSDAVLHGCRSLDVWPEDLR